MSMAKDIRRYVCSHCGATSPKWIGKCGQCDEWNTYQEEIVQRSSTGGAASGGKSNAETAVPITLSNITPMEKSRVPLNDSELNRVLGGGIVPGSMIFLGGEPGIGKSTLILQLAADKNLKILYVSGEESPDQIKMRAERMGITGVNCYIFAETRVDKIIAEAKKLAPGLLIIDSIQTIHTRHLESAPGSISQVRECTYELQQFAKSINLPVCVIGHITKEGSIAGPKVLEHIVDVVLQFEGDKHYHYRVLRAVKNRFGSTFEMGLYEMQSYGLRPVENPSELLISQNDENLSGQCNLMCDGRTETFHDRVSGLGEYCCLWDRPEKCYRV